MPKVSTQITDLDIEYSDVRELCEWLNCLVADVDNGRIIGFQLSTQKRPGHLLGSLILPAPSDLSVTLEVVKKKETTSKER